MGFGDLFKSTLESIKKPSIGLILICAVSAFISGVSVIPDVILNSNIVSSGYEEVAKDYDSKYLYDEEYEDINNDYGFYGDENFDIGIFEDNYTNNNEELSFDLGRSIITSIGVIAIVLLPMIIFVGMLVFNIVGTIYNYFMSAFALEVVEKKEISKGKNLVRAILAQLLVSMILFIPVIAMVVGLAISIALGLIGLFVILAVVFIVVLAYISIRFSSLGYTYVKYQNLKTVELVKKSWFITKGNAGKVFWYTILLGFILGIASLPLELVIDLLVSISPIIFLPLKVIVTAGISLVITVFSILFTTTLYRSLDNEVDDEIVENVNVESQDELNLEKDNESNSIEYVVDVNIVEDYSKED